MTGKCCDTLFASLVGPCPPPSLCSSLPPPWKRVAGSPPCTDLLVMRSSEISLVETGHAPLSLVPPPPATLGMASWLGLARLFASWVVGGLVPPLPAWWFGFRSSPSHVARFGGSFPLSSLRGSLPRARLGFLLVLLVECSRLALCPQSLRLQFLLVLLVECSRLATGSR